MHPLAVSVLLLALLPGLSSAFFPYLPDGYKKARKNVHLGHEVSKGFNEALSKLSLHKRAVPRGLVSRSLSDGGRALVRRLNDFDVDVSTDPTLPQSAAIDEDSTDYSYFSEVTIGSSPGEKVYLLMDTGSSALWVMGSNCTTTACKSHDTFGPSNSGTLSVGSATFDVGYATGTVTGPIGTDSLQLAGFNVKVEFGLANETSDDFDNYPMDGILGLARQPGEGFAPPTFLQTLQQNKLLKSNVFGMNLERAADNTNDGEINFGGFDNSKFKGDLNYISTTGGQNWWQIPSNGFMVDENLTTMSRKAIIDSGTSYIFLPPPDAKELLSQVPGSTSSDGSSWSIPCNSNVDIALVFNQIAYSISPKDYVGQSQSGGMCTSHIFGQVAVDDDTWLIGDTFMKNVYTVFDLDQNRIGFGAKGKTTNVGSSNDSGSSTSAVQSGSPSTTTGAASSSNPSSSPSAQATATGNILPGPGQTGGQPSSSGSPSSTTSDSPSASSGGPDSTMTGAGSSIVPASVGCWAMVLCIGLYMF